MRLWRIMQERGGRWGRRDVIEHLERSGMGSVRAIPARQLLELLAEEHSDRVVAVPGETAVYEVVPPPGTVSVSVSRDLLQRAHWCVPGMGDESLVEDALREYVAKFS